MVVNCVINTGGGRNVGERQAFNGVCVKKNLREGLQ